MFTRKDSFNKLHYNTLPKKLCDLGNYKRKEKREQKLLKRQKTFAAFFYKSAYVGLLHRNLKANLFLYVY